MPAIPLATDVTTVGQTAPVVMPESRCYVLQITWSGGTATIQPEFSIDGETFFAVTPVPPNLSLTANVRAHRIVDMPVSAMRINVTAIAEGVTVSAVALAL
ncbi:hypothetical protein [Streptomyces sp. URMC 129]|uniref:hypothetical protein n=1 Tax=Streptomyces sp. URMC 129 TaxID=3423407 RepID=UPI003F1C8BAE